MFRCKRLLWLLLLPLWAPRVCPRCVRQLQNNRGEIQRIPEVVFLQLIQILVKLLQGKQQKKRSLVRERIAPEWLGWLQQDDTAVLQTVKRFDRIK